MKRRFSYTFCFVLTLAVLLSMTSSVVFNCEVKAADDPSQTGFLNVFNLVKTVYIDPDTALEVCGDRENTEVLVLRPENGFEIAWDRTGWRKSSFNWDVDLDVVGDYFWMVNHPPIFTHQVFFYDSTGNLDVDESNYGQTYSIMRDNRIRLDYNDYDWGHTWADSPYDFSKSVIFSLMVSNYDTDAFQNTLFIFENQLEGHILNFKDTPTISRPVYRLLNLVSGEHLYTMDAQEKDALVERGWKDEGIAGNSGYYGKAVYRLYNPSTGQHLYSADSNECRVLTKKQGWEYDNGGNPVFNGTPGGNLPMYRIFDPDNTNPVSAHHYSSDLNEVKVLCDEHGWVMDNEGNAVWYLQ